jgi:serine protease AprX
MKFIILLCIIVFTCYCTLFEKIVPELQNEMKISEKANIMITMKEQVDFTNLRDYNGLSVNEMDHDSRGRFVLSELMRTTEITQKPLIQILKRRNLKYKAYYIVNVIAVWNVPKEVIVEIASRDDVDEIHLNAPIKIDLERSTDVYRYKVANETQWNVQWINTTYLWDKGFTGNGFVVANSDTGVDFTHPALFPNYRGNLGNGRVDHNYNWYDGVRSGYCGDYCRCASPEPCDDEQHGTHTMGTTAGQEGYGVAKGAKWIACRSIAGFAVNIDAFLNCFQFFLAPHDLNGKNPRPELRPHSTGHSYGCRFGDEICRWRAWKAAIDALHAAGVMVVASAGNNGPGCSTVVGTPGMLEEAFTVGALEFKSNTIAEYSSRGPVIADKSNRRKPDVVAPGSSVMSTVPGGRYTRMSGTSMSCPAVNGAIVLLWNAVPKLARNIPLTKKILESTALHQENTLCFPSKLPNHVYGWGTINLRKAYEEAQNILN